MIVRAEGIIDLIGRTPMVRVRSNLTVKLEFFNPGGSVKDRIALSMIEDAEDRGVLERGHTIVEPTSGNTGIGLAMVARARGYKIVLTMPETMSQERRSLLRAYGARLILTPGELGMRGAVERAEHLRDQTGAFMPGQFDNPANPDVHERTTAVEIWQATGGEVDMLVSGVGTGGTITGVSRAIKKQKPRFRAVAVEPAASPVLSGGKPGPHRIQGIGAGFIPAIYDSSVVDQVVTVTETESQEAARSLLREKGILAGISSGAAYHAALLMSREHPDLHIVAILPDGGERYLSTSLYGEDG